MLQRESQHPYQVDPVVRKSSQKGYPLIPGGGAKYVKFFFFNDAPTPEIYTLSLHDALPISSCCCCSRACCSRCCCSRRSEEHTSELQSRFDLVCRLLLEKKKNLGSPETMIQALRLSLRYASGGEDAMAENAEPRLTAGGPAD